MNFAAQTFSLSEEQTSSLDPTHILGSLLVVSVFLSLRLLCLCQRSGSHHQYIHVACRNLSPVQLTNAPQAKRELFFPLGSPLTHRSFGAGSGAEYPRIMNAQLTRNEALTRYLLLREYRVEVVLEWFSGRCDTERGVV